MSKQIVDKESGLEYCRPLLPLGQPTPSPSDLAALLFLRSPIPYDLTQNNLVISTKKVILSLYENNSEL